MTLETEADVRDAWSASSYSRFGRAYLPMAARLVDATDVGSGDDALDVACGTGNVAITATRRGAAVAGLDITPAMLDRAREIADIADAGGIEWYEGDATDLPFEANAFDATLSALGHMYGDPHDATARELVRVTRPGGRIGFTSWTPGGLFPIMAGLVASHLPPADQPEFSAPPFMWGDPSSVEDRLGDRTAELSFETDIVLYPALSPHQFWQDLVDRSGLFISFLEKVDDRTALREEMIETIEPYFNPHENAVELEYLLVTGTIA